MKNKTKNPFNHILLFIVSHTILYLTLAFYSADINFAHWGKIIRWFFSAISLVINLFIVLEFTFRNNDTQNGN